MKYHIEKNTVQETLIIPLFGKKKCSELYPTLYYDNTAIKVIEQIDYDFSTLEKVSKKFIQRFGFLEVAMRQNDLIWEIKDYLKTHPKASVVNLGCGLDDTGTFIDNGECKIYNLDFPEVIEIRNELIPKKNNEYNIPCNLNDLNWFEKIDQTNGAVFFAAGVFYYFVKEDVKKIITKMAEHFKGAKLVFDAANKKAVKLMLKTWIKSAKIKNVNAYFSVSNAKKEISSWSDNIEVSSRGYMLGYLDDSKYKLKGFNKLLSKIGDNMMKMQIVRIDFKERK